MAILGLLHNSTTESVKPNGRYDNAARGILRYRLIRH
jgi:hypothetical protein